MTKPYLLTEAAADDLRGILGYTRKTWGATQARRYAESLEQGIIRLATSPTLSKNMSVLYPTLRMARCNHHYVFCLPRMDGPALIIAILHERMDLIIRLQDRLNAPDP